MMNKKSDNYKMGMWRGKPVVEMSKKELIEALEIMSRLYNETLLRREKDLDILGGRR
jgi:hypothetical protein